MNQMRNNPGVGASQTPVAIVFGPEMLDTDYNGLVFHGCQVFFPRTGAWDNLKKTLKATHEESVWDHLAGAVSAPFEAGKHERIAVKVIDDGGNELLGGQAPERRNVRSGSCLCPCGRGSEGEGTAMDPGT